MRILIAIFLLILTIAFSKEIGFTQEDRKRLIRLETTLKVFMKQTDKRFEQIDKRISELRVDMNKRFELTDKRFEEFKGSMDKRFKEFGESIDKRFEEFRISMDKRFEEFKESMNKRFEEFKASIDKRFDQIDKRFDQLENEFNRLIQIMIGIFAGQFGLVGAVIAFALWDRRTIIRKAREETLDYLEREGKLRNLIEALREKAKTDTELARILRKYGLM